MKKSWLITILSGLVCALMLFGACAKTGFTVTVHGGTGGGTFATGERCTVTATLEEGESFLRWVDGDGEEVSRENPYTFTVEKDVELTAEKSVEKEMFTVTVRGGVITGTQQTSAEIEAGESVSVTAPELDSFVFTHWEIDGKKVSEDNPYVFTPTADTEIVAAGTVRCLILVEGGTLDDGTARRICDAGEEITLTADVTDGSFIYWYVLDENGAEKIVSRTDPYTFEVTQSDRYFARTGIAHTVTVEHGTFEGEDASLGSLLVPDGGSVVLVADPPAEENLHFAGWSTGGEVVSRDTRYTVRDIHDDVTYTATYSDYLGYLSTPVNGNSEQFRVSVNSAPDNYSPIEFDRAASGSVFADPHVSYLRFYVYDDPAAAKEDFVGTFVFGQQDGGWTMRLEDGTVMLNVEGDTGNFWIETKQQPDGQFYNKTHLFALLKKAVGEKYDARTSYYLAAQACSDDPDYAASEISEIGPQDFTETRAQKYNVTVEGGVITGTEKTSAIVFAGESVSVTATGEDFLYWSVEGSEVSRDNPYEFTPDADTAISAVYSSTVKVTVDYGEEQVESEIAKGESFTLVLDPSKLPAGKGFVAWKIGEDRFPETRHVIASVMEDTLVEVETADKLAPFEAPANGANEMLRFNNQGQLELDRQKNGDGSNKTVFTEGVDHIEFYVYTSADAEKETGSVGSFLVKQTADGRFALMQKDGSGALTLNGNAGDLYTGANYQQTFYSFLSEAVEDYDPYTRYYLAVRVCAVEGSIYVSSEISAIGSYGFVEFTERVEKLPTLENSDNEMFRYKGDYKPVELDRQGQTALKDHVDFVTFYIYTAPDADKNDFVGKFLLQQKDGNWVLTLEDGTVMLNVEGPPGNFWIETSNQPDGTKYSKAHLFRLFAAAVGEEYSKNQSYYLAAQACSKYDSVEDGDISAIGPAAFVEEAISGTSASGQAIIMKKEETI